jgi:hypothetical protein
MVCLVLLWSYAVGRTEVAFTFKRTAYHAVLDPSQPSPLQVIRGSRLIAATAKQHWNPWRLEVTDVDGDGKPELVIGVHKPTRHLPQPHTTIYVYTFDGKNITKKWLGSTLGRPLVDFCFGRVAGTSPSTLFTLERTLADSVALSRYEWSGFGFNKLPGELVWPTASEVRAERRGITLTVAGKRVRITMEDFP